LDGFGKLITEMFVIISAVIKLSSLTLDLFSFGSHFAIVRLVSLRFAISIKGFSLLNRVIGLMHFDE